ncbi:MAG: hypothetical protein U9P07_07735 [Pseudomonadota bacterium]|nr:hypothetical protein [Pseudomonadota bacterium]
MKYNLRKIFFFILLPLLGIAAIFMVESSGAALVNETEIQQLRRSVQALNQICEQANRELDEATATGRFSPREQHDYQTFIAYLGGRIEKYCRALYLAGGRQAVDGLACPNVETGLPTLTAPAAETTDEQIESLDTSLTKALGDFDEMLLEEQNRLASHQPRQRETGGSDGSDDFSGQEGRKTGTAGESTRENQDQAEESSDQKIREGESSEKMPAAAGKKSADSGARGAGNGNDQSSAVTRPSGPDTMARDDDIVARQLREAAEKETDPELKEKLWEEYRKYKAGK